MSKILFTGMSWNLFSRIFSNGSQLLIYFVLARLLSPTDFGVIAIVLVFINISTIFANAGLGSAIIQNKLYDKDKFNTIYVLSISFGIIISSILYVFSPFISSFFPSDVDLVFLIRFTIPLIIFYSINSIQISILQRDLNFKKMFVATSIPIIISGTVGIILAYFGFGVYSLIINSLLCALIGIIICFVFYVPIPNITFHLTHARSSMNYSYKILVAALIDEVNKSIFTLLIGKYFSNKTLGNYNFGRQLPGFASATLNATIATVFFPYYVKNKESLLDIVQVYRKVIRVLNFILFPLIFIFLLISKDLIIFLFTNKWIESVYYFNIFVIISGVYHLHTKITYYINALGYSEVTLKYEFIKKGLGLIVLLMSFSLGIKAIVIGQLIVAIISVFIMFYPIKKYLKINFIDQINDIIPLFLLSFISFIIVYWFKSYLQINNFSLLILSPLTYLFLYYTIGKIFKINSFNEFNSLMKYFNFKK